MKQIRFRNSLLSTDKTENPDPDLSHLEFKVCLCDRVNLSSLLEVIKGTAEQSLNRDAVEGARVGRMSEKVHSNLIYDR